MNRIQLPNIFNKYGRHRDTSLRAPLHDAQFNQERLLICLNVVGQGNRPLAPARAKRRQSSRSDMLKALSGMNAVCFLTLCASPPMNSEPRDFSAGPHALRWAEVQAGGGVSGRHCEEQRDEAIHTFCAARWIASLALAMTVLRRTNVPLQACSTPAKSRAAPA